MTNCEISCPHCQSEVEPTEIGRCPKCREMLPTQRVEVSSNPYQPPQLDIDELPRLETRVTTQSQLPWHFAVGSLAAPMSVVLLICLMWSMGPIEFSTLPFADEAMEVFVPLLVCGGFCLGVLGFVGGLFRDRHAWPIMLLSLLDGGICVLFAAIVWIAKDQ